MTPPKQSTAPPLSPARRCSTAPPSPTNSTAPPSGSFVKIKEVSLLRRRRIQLLLLLNFKLKVSFFNDLLQTSLKKVRLNISGGFFNSRNWFQNFDFLKKIDLINDVAELSLPHVKNGFVKLEVFSVKQKWHEQALS